MTVEPFRAALSWLLRRGKGTFSYPLADDITERLALQVLLDVFPRAMRGAVLRPRLAGCVGMPLVGSGVRITNPQLISCGRGFVIEDGAELQGLSVEGLRFGDQVTIGRDAQIRPSGYYGRNRGVGLSVGDNSSIGPQAFIGCSGGITIGTSVLMGPAVIILSEEHNFEDAQRTIKAQGVRVAPTCIEDDVWLGARSVVLGGTRVSHGAIVAAGAVVARDVPSGAIVAGVPARQVGERWTGFTEMT
jgi:acetyltransferase-like isoleucine patch superfamily enzyme